MLYYGEHMWDHSRLCQQLATVRQNPCQSQMAELTKHSHLRKDMHKNGVMVTVCPLVSSEMKVFRKKGDSHSRKEITSIQVSICLIPFDV